MRLGAAVLLAPRIDVAEDLLLGFPVPRSRLNLGWIRALGLVGPVLLDEELALRVVSHGPLGDA